MLSIVCGVCSACTLKQEEQGRYEGNIRENDLPDVANTPILELSLSQVKYEYSKKHLSYFTDSIDHKHILSTFSGSIMNGYFLAKKLM